MKPKQMITLGSVAVLAVILAVVVGLALTSAGPTKKRTRIARQSTAPTQTVGATPAATTSTGQADQSEERLAPVGEPDARLVAQRFLRAFAQYEVGRIDPAVSRDLRATSVPAFSASLLSNPPRAVRGLKPASNASVSDLTVTGEGANGAIEYLVRVDRGGTIESFSLTLTPAAGRWQVQRLNGA